MPQTLEQVLKQLSREGELYDQQADGRVRCFACGHRCLISEGRSGICRVRYNAGGRLYVPAGYVGSLQLDPVEKKPFFHALPGSRAMSFGMLGCDFHCSYCFVGTTRIITDRGSLALGELFDQCEKKINLDDGEAAFVENLYTATKDAKYLPLRKVFRHRYEGPMVKVKPYYFPEIQTTPEHTFFAVLKDNPSQIMEIQAKALREGDYLIIPRNWSQGNLQMIDVEELLRGHHYLLKVHHNLAEEEIKRIMELSEMGVSSRKIGEEFNLDHSYIRHVRSKVRRGVWVSSRSSELLIEGDEVRFLKEQRPGIPKTIPMDVDLARLLGFYCAEGCVVTGRNRPNSREIVFALSLKEEDLAHEIASLLKKIFIGYPASFTRRRTTLGVSVAKSSMGVLFKTLCGGRANEKQVPTVLFSAPTEVIEAFLSAYIRGDGHLYANGKVTATTVSEKLAYGLAQLVLQIGYLPAIYRNALPSEREIEGRRVKQSEAQYTVTWQTNPEIRRHYFKDEEFYYIPIKKIELDYLDGYVYNMEVEEDHTYLAGFFGVKNCQNWVTSQSLRDPTAGSPPQQLTPDDFVRLSKRHDAKIVTSTYNEPLITSEWAVEIFKIAKREGLVTSYVSNGNGTREVLEYIRPWVDLYKVDLKSFNDQSYRRLGGELQNVLNTIRMLHEMGFWLEIVTLIIPGFNDSDGELRETADFLVSVSSNIPWHVTAFHKDYKMTDPDDTSAQTLIRAADIGVKAGLKFVYAGNLPGRVGDFENTYCPDCRALTIERYGFKILQNQLLKGGLCPKCNTQIPGFWGDSVYRKQK